MRACNYHFAAENINSLAFAALLAASAEIPIIAAPVNEELRKLKRKDRLAIMKQEIRAIQRKDKAAAAAVSDAAAGGGEAKTQPTDSLFTGALETSPVTSYTLAQAASSIGAREILREALTMAAGGKSVKQARRARKLKARAIRARVRGDLSAKDAEKYGDTLRPATFARSLERAQQALQRAAERQQKLAAAGGAAAAEATSSSTVAQKSA